MRSIDREGSILALLIAARSHLRHFPVRTEAQGGVIPSRSILLWLPPRRRQAAGSPCDEDDMFQRYHATVIRPRGIYFISPELAEAC